MEVLSAGERRTYEGCRRPLGASNPLKPNPGSHQFGPIVASNQTPIPAQVSYLAQTREAAPVILNCAECVRGRRAPSHRSHA